MRASRRFAAVKELRAAIKPCAILTDHAHRPCLRTSKNIHCADLRRTARGDHVRGIPFLRHMYGV